MRKNHKAIECDAPMKSTDSVNAAEGVSLYVKDNYSLATYVSGRSNAQRDEKWSLDSGCTSHMANTNTEFEDIKSYIGNVKLASERASTSIQGKESVSIIAKNEGHLKNINVSDVLRVPQLRTNLLSVGKIIDRDYLVIFDKEKAEVIDKNYNIIMTADRRNNLYYVREIGDEYNANTQVANVTKNEKDRRMAQKDGTSKRQRSHRVQ